MTFFLDRRAFLAGGAASLSTSLPAREPAGAGKRSRLIDAERTAVRVGMEKDGIGCAAVCLVEGGEPIWMEGFGQTGGTAPRAAGPDTAFSIQSTSKNFTAVAVLLAVQDGLLDLDVPITRYLPDFKVQSRFEKAPQERMTLRLLLSNRAGFTHEAPVGNNYEPATPSFEAHVRSISDTWLRFPVGERYRYSNLGYDLAGYILERVTGLSYAEWLRRRLFEPLQMDGSTADPAIYARLANMAAGSHRGYDQVPLVTPLVASGGVYTTARDMANYAAFQAARGKWGSRQILAPELWAEMHGFSLGGDYGLGVMRDELQYGQTPVRLLHHKGGGFGFGCNFIYCPEADIGWAALFNRPALAGYRFGADLINRLLTERFGERRPRRPAAALAPVRPLASRAAELAGSYVGRNVRADLMLLDGQLRLRQSKSGAAVPLHATSPNSYFTVGDDGETTTYIYHPATGSLPAHLECSKGEASLDHNGGPADSPGPDKGGWDRYLGTFHIYQWGKPSMKITVERRNGYLYIDGIRLVVEEEPGLFFTSDGEAVDFRPNVPTWRNLLLRRS